MATVRRADSARAIRQTVELSVDDAKALVDATIQEIANRLVSGKTVKISFFGSFSLRDKAERIGRNPRTLAGC